MLKYVIKRIIFMFITLFIVVSITFFLINLIPGDPLASMGRNLPEQIKANYYAKYGLDQPLYIQYFKYMKQLIFHADLGESLCYPGRSVSGIIKTYSPVSARLGIQALCIGVILGIVFGIIAAYKRNTWPDYIVMILAVLGVSVPSFVLAAFLQYRYTVVHNWFPTIGWGSVKHTVLPTIALCFTSLATYARYMRANVLDIVNQDYLLTAKAKGVTGLRLVWKHVIRNAFLPAITILGVQVAMIFVGSFVIENIFGIPGLGFNYVSAINDRDYTMVLGQTNFFTFLYISSLLVIDILYGVIDPRIRLGKGKK
ncbi:ABC transporter permease [Abyssisolibacter fermentans]|uniref:ABC transporter permease n=1 Tax=Abyssisolibacter fermentans TaxID=1766203 RepID=UPI00082DD535|nr:ABC transporter permease [Abyssisolibacter fermentans]